MFKLLNHLTIKFPYSREKELYDEISNFVSDSENISDICEPMIGVFCLARFDDGYFRGQIVEIFCNEETLFAKLFLCDSGMFFDRPIEDCINIPKYLIDLLPFQVSLFCNIILLQYFNVT